MTSPKSGNAGSAVSPAEPKKAEEADKADPGEMTEVKARQNEAQTCDQGASDMDAHKPSDEANKKKTSWIEIEMKDEKKKPVTGLPYRITLPDGKTLAEGTLDEKGFARVSNIDPGNCKITFPTLDQEAWERA